MWFFDGMVVIKGFNGKLLVSIGIGNLVVNFLDDVIDEGF